KVVEDLDAIDRVPAGERFWVLTAVIEAHARRNQPDRAMAAADRLPTDTVKALGLYPAAFGCARCIPLADTPELKERCAVKAMELAATFQADLIGMAQRCFHLSLAGHLSGIAIIDGVLSQGIRLSP